MNPEMHLLHVPSTTLGYGRYGVKLSEALTRAGVDNTNTLHPSDLRNVVAWVSTPAHAEGWFDGQYKVLSTMWESKKLPEAFREHFHEFDLIVVPSEHNVELMSPFHDNVQFVPLGVDTAEWFYTPRQSCEDRFNFMIAGSGTRKGTDLAYRAFKKLYGKTWPTYGPVPYLIMKSPRSEDFYGERIERIGGKISDADERAVYGMAHCYLQPSRGEGWGLQPLQAMAQGIPTILTNAHGHQAFADLGFPISAGTSKASYFTFGDAGEWWEPDFDQLCGQMEYVYENYEVALERAQSFAPVINLRYSWDNTASRFVDAIGRYRLEVPYAGAGKWQKPFSRRYLVRVNRPWACHIAHVEYRFETGRDYWEVADVKRILFEAEVLDPSCLTVDNGLAQEQLAKIPDYTAAHSRCPTCHQILNTDMIEVTVDHA